MGKKSKVAIVFSDTSLETRRGIMNAVLARVEHLIGIVDYQIDVFCLVPSLTFLASFAKREKKKKLESVKIIDGITINVLPYTFSILGYILTEKLRWKDLINLWELRKMASVLKEYNLISAHSTLSASLAMETNNLYGVPFVVTWHGSDIHTVPWQNTSVLKKTKHIIKKASLNIFVSRALMLQSNKIGDGNKTVLYNAASEVFSRLPEEAVSAAKLKYQVAPGQKVVLYAGNFFSVKNADILPDIFNEVQKNFKSAIKFLIAGDGDLRNVIEKKLSGMKIDCVLLGNKSPNEMPELMNVADLLVLPSRNEGLPLVVVEACRCGCKVVGSDVGGISEIIGKDNVVPLGDSFIKEFSAKVVSSLSSEFSDIKISDDFDWSVTAQKENALYTEILKFS